MVIVDKKRETNMKTAVSLLAIGVLSGCATVAPNPSKSVGEWETINPNDYERDRVTCAEKSKKWSGGQCSAYGFHCGGTTAWNQEIFLSCMAERGHNRKSEAHLSLTTSNMIYSMPILFADSNYHWEESYPHNQADSIKTDVNFCYDKTKVSSGSFDGPYTYRNMFMDCINGRGWVLANGATE